MPQISKRNRIPTNEFLQSVAQQDLTFDHRVHQPVPYQLPSDTPPKTIVSFSYYDALRQDNFIIQDELQNPIAFQTQIDKDTLYYSQEMRANDKRNFQNATKTEFDANSDRKHWDAIPLKDAPNDEKVLDSIWVMRRKKNSITNEVYKHKARLNIHGDQQEFAIKYNETLSPVFNWFAIRILLIHAVIFKWITR